MGSRDAGHDFARSSCVISLFWEGCWSSRGIPWCPVFVGLNRLQPHFHVLVWRCLLAKEGLDPRRAPRQWCRPLRHSLSYMLARMRTIVHQRTVNMQHICRVALHICNGCFMYLNPELQFNSDDQPLLALLLLITEVSGRSPGSRTHQEEGEELKRNGVFFGCPVHLYTCVNCHQWLEEHREMNALSIINQLGGGIVHAPYTWEASR